MKVLLRFFDFYLYASIHVALAIFSLTWITYQTFNISIDKHLLYFIFFGSISCYNFIKYGVEEKKYILVSRRYHQNIQIFSLICLLAACYHAYFLNLEALFGILVLVLLTGLYALPVLPKAKNLRSWGGLKIFVVALVWVGTTVILPVLSVQISLSWDVVIETIQRFLLVLILLVPFEIRDLKYDATELKTIPQRYGVAKTKIFGAFLTLFFFFMTFLKDDISKIELISKGILFLCLGILMFVTKREQSKYFASFWVESLPIFWLGIFRFASTF
jgi:hypothetical protein